jgi:tRNA threonylcarbamoyladenosine biosynthesis protein TsaB
LILLSFDTSTDALSIAVSKDGTILKESHTISAVRHSSALIPAIEKILRDAKIRIEDVDVIAVGLGPGSFTGIRVGVVTAKMLAVALKIKIVGVSSLEAIARAFLSAQDPKVAVMLDARKSKAYTAAYELKNGRIRSVVKPALKLGSESTLFIKKGFKVVGDEETKPNARFIAEAGHDLAKQKKFTSPNKLDPEYLHPRDCNVTLKK